MKENKITNFQKYCIDRCKIFLRNAINLENVYFEEEFGKTEIYYKTLIKVADHTIELYIYADEAGFMMDGQHWTIYEKPDYSSDEQLVDAYIKGLSKVILIK